MKSLIAFSLVLLLVGCVSAPESKSSSQAQAAAESPILVVKKQALADAKLSGRNYFLDLSIARTGLSEATFKKLVQITRDDLKSLGFQEVTSPRKAHLTVYLVARRALEPEAEGVVTRSETRRYVVQDGEEKIEVTKESSEQMAFDMVVHVNRYAKRPEVAAYLTMRPPTEQWTGSEDQLVTSFHEQLKDLLPKAPRQNEKMKGDPGCPLRFGFDTDASRKVNNIFKGSPAEKAGIKKGDVVESIDSVPYSTTGFENDVYVEGLKVPLKLKRGEKTIRSEIAAQVVCGK